MINKNIKEKTYELLKQILLTYKISNNINYTTYEFYDGLNVFIDIGNSYTKDLCRIDFLDNIIRFTEYNSNNHILHTFNNYDDYEKFIISYELKF